MILNTQTWATIVQNQAVAIQTKAAALVDFTVGSILRSIIEAVAGVVLWLQAIVLQVMALTRAATSNLSDLDSWMADWSFYRLGANGAIGYETFARFTPTLQAVVPLGATVQSNDGTQTFTVILDTTNVNFNAGLGGYVIPAGTASIACLVQANTASTASNVQANTLTVLTTPIAGVDYVNNAGAFTGGSSPETDSAFRARFWLYILSLRAATKGAVSYAVASMQVGLAYQLVENYTYGGAYQPGYFYVVVDDGSGAPPALLVTNAYLAIDAIRPLTSTFATFAPVVVTANVSMTLTTAAGYNHAAVAGAVGAAITVYVSNLGLGNPLNYFRLSQIAMDTPGVSDVSAYTLNSGIADIPGNPQQTIKPGSVSVN